MNKLKIEIVPLGGMSAFKKDLIKVDGRYLLDGKTGSAVVVDGSSAARVVVALQNWEKLRCVS